MGKKYLIIIPYAFALLILIGLGYFHKYELFSSLRSERLSDSVRAHVSNAPADENDLKKLNEAVLLDPNNCSARYALAFQYRSFSFRANKTTHALDKKEFLEAVRHFEEVIKRCENSSFENYARYMLALSYYDASDFDRSEEYAYTLLDQYPASSEARVDVYDLLASIYEKKSDDNQRIAMLVSSLSLSKNADTHIEKLEELISVAYKKSEFIQSLKPTKPASSGKYTSAVISKNRDLHLLGLTQNPPTLSYFALDKTNWKADRILLVKDNPLGVLSIQTNGIIHSAYALHNAVYYLNNIENIQSKPILLNQQMSVVDLGYPITSLQMRLDTNGAAHLIWAYPSIGLSYTKIANGEIVANELIAPYGLNADLALDKENIYIVYNVDNGIAFPNSSSQVWFQEKKNGSWSAEPLQLNRGRQWAGGATINIAQNGIIHVLFLAGLSQDDVKLMYLQRDQEGNWTEPIAIAEGNYRPWIPTSYRGRYAPVAKVLRDGSFALVWRVPKDENSTYLVGRKLDQSGWSAPVIITEIPGQDYNDTPSIVQENQPYPDNLKLIWSNAGKIKYFEWQP